MKTKLAMAAAIVGLFAISCGESAEHAEEMKAKLEEVKELGNKLNDVETDIQELEQAEADAEALINELDEI